MENSDKKKLFTRRLDAQQGTPTLNEKETLDFLRAHAVERLADWQQGEPVLYLLPERVRRGIKTSWKYSNNRIPSIARVESPRVITLPEGHQGARGRGLVGDLHNDGGRIDYYAIRREDNQPILVRTSRTNTRETSSYAVMSHSLYRAQDDLFPPGTDSVDS